MSLFYLERRVYILYFVISLFFCSKVRFSVRLFFRRCTCLSICLSQCEMKLPIHFSRCGSKSTMASELCLSVCLKVSRQLTFLCLKENIISLNYQDHATQHQRNFIILCSIFAFYSCKWMIYTEIWYSCGIWHFYECNGYVLLNYSRLGDTLSRYMPE